MKAEDTLPWYRQFWPWFIISLPAITVVAGVYTLWLAMQGSDSLVIDTDGGVDVVTARNAAAEREAARLGLAATLEFDLETGALALKLTSSIRFDDEPTLRLDVLHPTMAGLDTTISLSPAIAANDGTAVWAGHFVRIPSSRRYLVLASGDDWRLSGEWSGEAQFHMAATSVDDGTR